MAGKALHVTCPGCSGQLTIDAATGEILHHEQLAKQPGGGKSMEELLDEVDTSKARAEEIFEQEKLALRDRERLLDEKFNEALRRAERAGEAGD